MPPRRSPDQGKLVQKLENPTGCRRNLVGKSANDSTGQKWNATRDAQLTGRSGVGFRSLTGRRVRTAGTKYLLQGQQRITTGIAFDAAAQALVSIRILRRRPLR